MFPDNTVTEPRGMTFDAQLTTRNQRGAQLLLPASSVTFCSITADSRSTAHPVHAFITSCVDYCNALLYGVANGIIRRIQSVLHAATWLIAGIRRYVHITPDIA